MQEHWDHSHWKYKDILPILTALSTHPLHGRYPANPWLLNVDLSCGCGGRY